MYSRDKSAVWEPQYPIYHGLSGEALVLGVQEKQGGDRERIGNELQGRSEVSMYRRKSIEEGLR